MTLPTNPVPFSTVRLHNPIPAQDGERERLGGAWIAKSEYEYLFRGVLQGVHGSQSAIIGQLISKLNSRLRELNIPNYYEPNNESIVAELLAGLTFGTPCTGGSTAKVADPARGLVGPTPGESDRSARPRTQRRATPGVRSGKPNKKGKRPDTQGGAGK